MKPNFTKLFFIYLLFISLSVKCFAENSYSIAATVDGNIIFNFDVTERSKILNLLDSSKQSYDNILNQLIDETLIIEDSKNYNLEITPNDVKEEIKNVENLHKWSNNQIYTLAKKSNIDKKSLNKYFYNQTVVKKLIQYIGYNSSSVSEEELESEYLRILSLNGKMQFLISEIFVSSTNKTDKKAQQQINKIYNSLKAGKSFEALASTSSDNLYGKNNNGSVGWVYENQISDEERDALSNTKIGTFTKPIKVVGGYKIFFVKNVQPIIYIDPDNYEYTNQLKLFIKTKIQNDKAQAAIQTYINNLHNKANIKINS